MPWVGRQKELSQLLTLDGAGHSLAPWNPCGSPGSNAGRQELSSFHRSGN